MLEIMHSGRGPGIIVVVKDGRKEGKDDSATFVFAQINRFP